MPPNMAVQAFKESGWAPVAKKLEQYLDVRGYTVRGNINGGRVRILRNGMEVGRYHSGDMTVTLEDEASELLPIFEKHDYREGWV